MFFLKKSLLCLLMQLEVSHIIMLDINHLCVKQVSHIYYIMGVERDHECAWKTASYKCKKSSSPYWPPWRIPPCVSLSLDLYIDNSIPIYPIALLLFFSLHVVNMDILRKLAPVFLFASCVFLITNNNGVEGSHRIYSRLQNVPAGEVNQVHRTAYHFQPPKHWINGIFPNHHAWFSDPGFINCK